MKNNIKNIFVKTFLSIAILICFGASTVLGAPEGSQKKEQPHKMLFVIFKKTGDFVPHTGEVITIDGESMNLSATKNSIGEEEFQQSLPFEFFEYNSLGEFLKEGVEVPLQLGKDKGSVVVNKLGTTSSTVYFGGQSFTVRLKARIVERQTTSNEQVNTLDISILDYYRL